MAVGREAEVNWIIYINTNQRQKILPLQELGNLLYWCIFKTIVKE